MPGCRKSHLIFQNFLEEAHYPLLAPLSKIPGSAPELVFERIEVMSVAVAYPWNFISTSDWRALKRFAYRLLLTPGCQLPVQETIETSTHWWW